MKEVTLFKNFTEVIGNTQLEDLICDIRNGKYKWQVEKLRKLVVKTDDIDHRKPINIDHPKLTAKMRDFSC